MVHGIFTEYGGNAEDIPHSVAPITTAGVESWKTMPLPLDSLIVLAKLGKASGSTIENMTLSLI
jgi:hypothetical protein